MWTLPTLDPVSESTAANVRVRLFSRDGLLCSALLGLSILATWPVAEIGINDDWSFIRTAQVFAHTHHFVYNGWSAAILGWQVIWGSLFAWIFGASYTAIRLSNVPIALAVALLYHAILRRFGLNRAHAVFGTLALTLSPLFVPVADTFMSDIPGLFTILLCLYMCQRAIAAERDSRVAMWIVLAGLTNIPAGTVRQVSWLGVLVMLPCCGWILRRRRFVVPATVLTWLVGAISIHFVMAWFLRQPYSIRFDLFPEKITPHVWYRIIGEIPRSSMSTLLFLLPAMALFAAAVWPPRKSQIIRLACVFSCIGALGLLLMRTRVDVVIFPWLTGTGNVITPHGMMQDSPLFGSVRQVPDAWLILLLAIFILCFVGWMEARRAFPLRSSQPFECQNRRTMSVLLLPTLVAYCILMLPFAARLNVFDRYLLVIVAVLLIYMLRAHQDRVGPGISAAAIVALVIFAVLGIAATHDLFAMDRAEVRAVAQLERAGIPRTQIRGGFAFDSITQVDTTGYVNDPHITNPPNSYHPLAPVPPVIRDGVYCGYNYLRYVPALDVHYEISADANPCLGPTSFVPEAYVTWLPPARRELFIGRLLPDEDHTPTPTVTAPLK